MSAPPKTVLQASPEEEARIRAAVRNADPSALGGVVATQAHVAELVTLLSDPAVSAPIYDLPNPVTPESVASWIADAEQKRQAGEALLVVNSDAAGHVRGYSRFTIWPERSSAEIAGAVRGDLQNSGAGRHGAARSFDWMFETFGVRLIGLTAALDNIRSARVIEAAGFTAMGEREAIRPDGSVRRSQLGNDARELGSAAQPAVDQLSGRGAPFLRTYPPASGSYFISTSE